MLTTKRLVAQVGVAAVAGLLHAAAVQATTTPDRAAAIIVYPKVVVDTTWDSEFGRVGTDTIIQVSNEGSVSQQAHCFYVNANSHCTNTGLPCRSGSQCAPFGACVPGWAELDFSIVLTPHQPFYWLASTGRNPGCAGRGCDPLPLGGAGQCSLFPFPCMTDAECQAIGAGTCVGGGVGNAGTSIPPVPENPFVGELKCVAVNANGTPSSANQLVGQATIVTVPYDTVVDAQSYAATGIRAYSDCDGGDNNGLACVDNNDCPGGGSCQAHQDGDNVLVLGGPARACGGLGGQLCTTDGDCTGTTCQNNREYEACPSTLIVNHLFDGAPDPIDGEEDVVTDLTLVPCTEDFYLGSANPGRATAQFLVFNEFEQRFSTSRQVDCFDEVLLSNIDTRNNERSIFSINVAGTIAGQTRITGIGAGLLGVPRLMRAGLGFPPSDPGEPMQGVGAAYNAHEEGQRNGVGEEDVISLP